MPRSYFSDSQIAEGYRPNPQIYIKLIQECEKLGKEGEFSSCFTELQRGFLRQRPTKVKSLVRLVKHWYQKVWGGGGCRGKKEEERGKGTRRGG